MPGASTWYDTCSTEMADQADGSQITPAAVKLDVRVTVNCVVSSMAALI
jgi:hypothetical protein